MEYLIHFFLKFETIGFAWNTYEVKVEVRYSKNLKMLHADFEKLLITWNTIYFMLVHIYVSS